MSVKKWITVLLALLICMLAVAQAEESPFTGYWELDSLEYDGRNANAADLSFGVTLVIRGDGTMIFALAEDQFVTEQLTAEESATGWKGYPTLESMSPMYISFDGRLCFTLNGEMVVRMRRSQPAGDPVTGAWTIDHAYKNGERQSRDTLRDIGLTVEEDQFGVLSINGKCIHVRLFLRDGELVVLRDDGHVYPATLSEDGQILSLDLTTTEGSAWTLVLTRPAQAETTETEQLPVQTVPAEAENPFLGMWVSTSASVEGRQFVPDQLITLRIDGESGVLSLGDDTSGCRLEYVRDEAGQIVRCNVSDNSDMTASCTIGADGLLVMAMDGDSGRALVYMARDTAEEPASQPVQQPEALSAATSAFDGTWVLTEVRMNGVSHAPEQLGMEGTLRITGESARYTVGKENTLGLVTELEDGLSLYCRSGEYRFVTDEAGNLCQEAQSFGLTVTLCFTRQP